MATVLYEAPVFGPINSRRLGVSLGVNLLPADGKLCSFNCLYCECGLNEERRSQNNKLSDRTLVKETLEKRLQLMSDNGDPLNVITFAGNGEPTIHPDFSHIIDDTIVLRDKYFPNVKISVLSNSVHLDRPLVVSALKKVDNAILKLDSAVNRTFSILNNPKASVTAADIIKSLTDFEGKMILQTLFCFGEYNGVSFNNTSDEEVEALIKAYKSINPDEIMIYSLARETPVNTIYKVEKDKLEEIALRLRAEGFNVDVS